MITARNYAAQAESFCNTAINNLTVNGYKEESKLYLDIKNFIKASVHFAVPDGGLFLDDKLKGIKNDVWRLPYDLITIEYFVKEEVGNDWLNPNINKRLIIAAQQNDRVVVMAMFYDKSNDAWMASTAGAEIPKRWWDETDVDLKLSNLDEIRKGVKIDDIRFAIKPVVLQPNMFQKVAQQIGKTKAMQLITHDIHSECRVVLELCEALSCKNVYTESLEVIDERVNEKRIKAGKVPFYETKILIVDSKPKEIDTTWKGGTHASPKQHLRRGHIRRYSWGNIWINNTIVGKSSNGKIDKSYTVK